MSPIKRQNLVFDGVGVLATLLAIGLFYHQSVRPWLQQDHANQAKRHQLTALRQREANACSEARRLTTQLTTEQNALPASAPSRDDVRKINSRLARIASLASTEGLQLRNVEPGRAIVGGDRVVVPIHLTGTADYRGCAQFLQEMRVNFSDTSVWSLRMSATAAGDKVAVDFDMNLRWYAASAVASVQN